MIEGNTGINNHIHDIPKSVCQGLMQLQLPNEFVFFCIGLCMPEIKVTPLGAGQDVGRSCLILTQSQFNIMLDCGMHMGYQDFKRFPDFSYFNVEDLDLIIISHFHLDHCGALPYFTERFGYRGSIIMTHPTRAIAPLLLNDMRKVMQEKSKESFFSEIDVINCMKKVVCCGIGETIEIENGLKITAHYAGHVLGAAMFEIRTVDILGSEIVTVYTGDYNTTPDRHLGGARLPRLEPDLLITESTYATTVRASKRSRESSFLQKVHEAVQNGGKVLIPVFALGRAQELLILIEGYWNRTESLQNIPIYFSAGLTSRANDYYKMFTDWTNESIQSTYRHVGNPFNFSKIKTWHPEYVDLPGPCVLFASPGMLHAGTSLSVFSKWAEDEKNMVIMPGYCVAGTVGAKILAGEKQVEIDRFRTVNVNLQVRNMSFSAHSDQTGILQLISQSAARNVMLVHGEGSKMAVLAEKIKEIGIPTYYPKNGETAIIPLIGDIPMVVPSELKKGAISGLAQIPTDTINGKLKLVHGKLEQHELEFNTQPEGLLEYLGTVLDGKVVDNQFFFNDLIVKVEKKVVIYYFNERDADLFELLAAVAHFEATLPSSTPIIH